MNDALLKIEIILQMLLIIFFNFTNIFSGNKDIFLNKKWY